MCHCYSFETRTCSISLFIHVQFSLLSVCCFVEFYYLCNPHIKCQFFSFRNLYNFYIISDLLFPKDFHVVCIPNRHFSLFLMDNNIRIRRHPRLSPFLPRMAYLCLHLLALLSFICAARFCLPGVLLFLYVAWRSTIYLCLLSQRLLKVPWIIHMGFSDVISLSMMRFKMYDICYLVSLYSETGRVF